MTETMTETMNYHQPDPTKLTSAAQVWDLAVSYTAAIAGDQHPIWWVERPISKVADHDFGPDNQTLYTLKARISGCDILLRDLYENLPEQVLNLVQRAGWTSSLWAERTQELVQESIMEASWRAIRDPAAGVVRGFMHRVPPSLFAYIPETNQAYWHIVLDQPDVNAAARHLGLPEDQWVRRVKELLQAPATVEAQSEGVPLLRRLLRYRGPWEFLAQQSFRMWASDQPSWTPPLDLFEVSYRTFHEGSPLVVQAIEKGWVVGVQGWLRDAQATLAAIPLWDHIPLAWQTAWDPEQPTGTLWHWCCARGTPDLLDALLLDMPAAVEVCAPDGRTGLHWACACGREDLVDILLANGADLSVEDNEGSIAAQMIPPGNDAFFDRLEDLRLGYPEIQGELSGSAAKFPKDSSRTQTVSPAVISPASIPAETDAPASPAADEVDYSGLFPDF
jgi:hypothetical protein